MNTGQYFCARDISDNSFERSTLPNVTEVYERFNFSNSCFQQEYSDRKPCFNVQMHAAKIKVLRLLDIKEKNGVHKTVSDLLHVSIE